MSPILVVHICGGTLGLVSGAAAMSFRKGSRWHVLAGKIFVASMLTMAVGATWLAIQKHESGNIGGGVLTFYMILTHAPRGALTRQQVNSIGLCC